MLTDNNSKIKYNIGIDVNGADKSPYAFISAAALYTKEHKDIIITLFGNKEIINSELSKSDYNKDLIKIVHTSQEITTNDHPAISIKEKKDSSMVVGLKELQDDKLDAFLSAGNSGSLFIGSNHFIKTIENIKRPIFATFIPTIKKESLLLDCGANLNPKSDDLIKYAYVGTTYFSLIKNKDNPSVGILNIGEEDEKGTEEIIKAIKLLRNNNDINFAGSLEAREMPQGNVDIIVTDAFTGNIALKIYEGTAKVLLKMIKSVMFKNIKTKIGTLFIKKELKNSLKKMSTSEFAGAPLLGLKKLVIKMHGNSDEIQVVNSINQAVDLLDLNLIYNIRKNMTYNNEISDI